MNLSINLSTRRYINSRQVSVGLVCGMALMGALVAAQVDAYRKNADKLQRLELLNQRAAAVTVDRRVTVGQVAAQKEKVRFVNAALEKRAVNWLEILDQLELVVPAGIALTQIEPDPQQGLKISGVALGFANLKELLENLEQSQRFRDTLLLSQSDKSGSGQAGVAFTLSCRMGKR